MDRKAYQEMAQTERTHWWFVGRRRIIRDTIERLELPHEPRILEAGAGTGGNLKMLSELGDLTAMEIDDEARAHAAETSGITVIAGRLPNGIPDFKDGFDLICLFDVLEHVEQDTETLAMLGQHLKPGGKMLVTVPAYPWMWSSHDEVLHHFRRYTKQSLAKTIELAGLRQERLTHFNAFLLPAAILARTASKFTRRQKAVGADLPPKPVNGLFKSVFSSETTLLRHTNLSCGLSLMAILSADVVPVS